MLSGHMHSHAFMSHTYTHMLSGHMHSHVCMGLCHKAADVIKRANEDSPVPSGYAGQRRVVDQVKKDKKAANIAILPAAL